METDAHDRATVSSSIARALLRTVERAGGSPAEVLAEAGLDASEVATVGGRVTAEQESAVWRSALRRTEDPLVGLRAAEVLGRGHFGALEYVVRSSGTLTEGLQRLARYGALLHGTTIFSLSASPAGGACLVYHSPHDDEPEVRAAAGDFALAAVLLLGRQATGVDLTCRRARLARPRPPDTSLHERVFGPGLELDAAEWSLLFDSDALATPMTAADPALRAVLERFLDQEAEQRDPNAAFLALLRREIRDRLHEDAPQLADVADSLGLGERTLQRRLEELGTSFSAELDEVRRDLAQSLLRRPDVTVEGVALLLGYSDVSAFHRAFRRWTGTTPGRFRRGRREMPSE